MSEQRFGVQAFADSWAAATDCNHKCVVDAVTATEAFGEVLAVASSEAFGTLCVGAPPHACRAHQMCTVHNMFLLFIAKMFWAS